jgi:hypothetical protein
MSIQSKHDIENAVDALIRCKGRLVDAQIDAASCMTTSDWKRMHKCEEEFEDLLGNTLDALTGLLQERDDAVSRARQAESTLARIKLMA